MAAQLIRAAWLVAAFTGQLVLGATPGQASDAAALAELAKPGRLLMLRHALAPGTGDPANFKLGDCSTQRNLDAVGRAQAERLGARLRAAGITRAKVYSSQWCRCLETARRLDLGPVEELPLLNSIYQRPQERETRIPALRAFLAKLPTGNTPVIFVTHQFTISEFTGGGTGSGGGTVFALNGTGEPRPVGALSAD